MEGVSRESSHGCGVKEEKRIESRCDQEDCKDQMVLEVGNRRNDQEGDTLSSMSPNQKDLGGQKQDDQLEIAKAAMSEVREENQRLRTCIDQMMKDYQSLQKQFRDIVEQDAKKSSNKTDAHQDEMEESELVSLSLGRTSSDPKNLKDDKYKIPCKGETNHEPDDKDGSLVLGLDSKYEVSRTGPAGSSLDPSPENSSEVKEQTGDTWPPGRVLKTVRSGDEEVSQQNPAKKARVSVRVRCDTPTMNDGCQWRKYGQKIAKGNPCPRAYYRCTVAPSCPVRKQVQRYAEDMSILITTYEGTHNHPLPMSATAMASTTSAAASMLLSGSSTSGSGPNQSATATTTSPELHGLNFYLSDSSKPRPFYLPNSSISSSPSCPTITLDLTSNSASSSSHFNKFFTNFPPRYSSTNLNFSSLESSNTLPLSWTNPPILNYGTQYSYSKNQMGSLNFGREAHQENLYLSCMQKNNITNSSQAQPLPPDTIEAATKAITSDPSFQSALAAALTSIIGSNTGGGIGGTVGNHGGGDKFPALSNFPSTSNANKCSPPTKSQPRSLMMLPNSLAFVTSKSKCTSPEDN
ncbi:hypothetical protein RJ639_040376 [Escallonia herrerae]|uniref:WRKY domain-containing protein n=1 Tax=Escallonia herrerae TaxID=1293975 RepID=A0AA88WQS8_9ASTE|nr:hypothetical protein RJ639_040376 [Escallonia herrerae]